MTIKTEYFCPLGKVCEEIKDGIIHRCRAFVTIKMQNPQDHSQVIDDTRCSIFEWSPVLMLDMSKTNIGQTQAIDSLRDTVSEGQKSFALNLLGLANESL